MKKSRLTEALFLVPGIWLIAATATAIPTPIPVCAPSLEQYYCPHTDEAPIIDGNLDEAAWSRAPWSADFVDIEGDLKPPPTWRTNQKMLWDDTHLYIAARLEEPHVWATLTQRDAVIYHDNDFEVFIDPDGDNHLYYELEINALGTEWDLLLVRPYRDGAPAVNAWDIQGLKTAVMVDGTLNDPSDRDQGWTVEIAIPWEVLAQCAGRPVPPTDGDIWRMNFSRVQWQTQVQDWQYVKIIDPETGRPLPENNWVWSPQGLIAMHYPERWGEVMFIGSKLGTGNRPTLFDTSPEHQSILTGNHLMPLYYAQKSWFEEHGFYAGSLTELGFGKGDASACPLPTGDAEGSEGWLLEMEGGGERFLGRLITPHGIMTIDEQGCLVRDPLKGKP